MFKRMMILRYPDWIEQLIFRSKVQECYAGFGGIAKFVDECFFSGMQGSEDPAGTHDKLDQSTGEVLFAVGGRDNPPSC